MAGEAERVAVVAHGGTIRVLLAGILGMGQERRFWLGDPVENCGISHLRVDLVNRRLTVHTFNDTAHLTELA